MSLIIANWKMNLCDNINLLEKFDNSTIIICPPYTHLSFVKGISNISIGAQDVSYMSESYGAYTGEVSAEILAKIGCSFCIVGHSERRMFFNETNDIISKKIINLYKYDITPIICVGEDAAIKESGKLFGFLEKQLDELLSNSKNKDFIIAYEPIWAIGTGKIANIEDINEISKFIHEYCVKKFDKKIRVVYGGSVNLEMVENILLQEWVDGVLIGNACLDINKFNNILKVVDRI